MNSKWEEKNLEECIAAGDVRWALVCAATAVSLRGRRRVRGDDELALGDGVHGGRDEPA